MHEETGLAVEVAFAALPELEAVHRQRDAGDQAAVGRVGFLKVEQAGVAAVAGVGREHEQGVEFLKAEVEFGGLAGAGGLGECVEALFQGLARGLGELGARQGFGVVDRESGDHLVLGDEGVPAPGEDAAEGEHGHEHDGAAVVGAERGGGDFLDAGHGSQWSRKVASARSVSRARR